MFNLVRIFILFLLTAIFIDVSSQTIKNTCSDLGISSPRQVYDCTLVDLGGDKRCCYVSVAVNGTRSSACMEVDRSSKDEVNSFIGNITQIGTDATIECSGTFKELGIFALSLIGLVIF